MFYFSVCTPTYNRAHTLPRTFLSLMRQTYRDFEWIIVDDGSTDETEMLVQRFVSEADFPIRYIKQENKGRAGALNEAYGHVSAKYIANMDSDDEFTDDALQILHDTWENIPEKDYERFWCITAHCIDSSTGKQIGPMWPEGINDLSGRKQHKLLTKYKGGEKYCCRKTEVLKKYPFPQFEDTKFVPENIVWEKINQSYDQYCLNHVVRIYHTDSGDALSKSSHKMSTKNSYYHATLFYINDCFSQITYNKAVMRAFLDISRLAIITGRTYRSVMEDINAKYKRAMVGICWPVVWLFTKIYYRKTRFI